MYNEKIVERISQHYPISPDGKEIKTKRYSIWKIRADSNLYLLDFKEPILIDTGDRSQRAVLRTYLDKIIPLSSIRKVIFTHLHYDHTGNFDLFRNAEFFASGEEMEDFKNNPEGAVLDRDLARKFNIELNEAKDVDSLNIIHTPGHTRGSICIWYEQEKILFSGDTLFENKKTGRVDLPTSVPKELDNSMAKLVKCNFKILCPGHDY